MIRINLQDPDFDVSVYRPIVLEINRLLRNKRERLFRVRPSQAYVGTPEEAAARAYRKAANKRYRDSHLEEVRERDRLRMQQERATNPVHTARIKEASRRRHPETHREGRRRRRARFANVVCNLTTAQWLFVQQVYDFRCAYCHRKMQRLHKHLTLDHITPVIHGGAHTVTNVVPACRSCNAKKHDGPPLIPVQPVLPFAL